MTDINVGALSEAINDKMDRDGMNAVSGVDFVVETQLPTSSNNYIWYRLYKSGWVEQGCNYTTGAATFPVEMADTNYQVNTLSFANYSSNILYVVSKSTTSVSIWHNNDGAYSWEVKGMAATTS